MTVQIRPTIPNTTIVSFEQNAKIYIDHHYGKYTRDMEVGKKGGGEGGVERELEKGFLPLTMQIE